MSFHGLLLVLLGLILAFYWGKVLEMAARSRRRAGRSANFVPPEPLGRILRFAWIPAVAAWVLSPFVAALSPNVGFFRPLHSNTAITVAGVTLAAAALIATLVCWRRMGRAWRMGIDPAEKNPLVTSGPFAVVRHPIYALSTLLMLASVVAVLSPLLLLAAAIHLPLLQWESLREEHHMRRVHGERYEQYCRRVGRFVPRLRKPSGQTAQAI